MAHGPMTLGATGLMFHHISMRRNISGHIRMAFDAIVLQIPQIGLGDAYRLRIILKRESLRMIPTVLSFDDKFLRDGMRHMTVIAGGCFMMTPPLPGVIILRHHMTVGARRRIVA